MASIPSLKQQWDAVIRQEMAARGITTDEVADQFDAVANELVARGFVEIPDLAALATLDSADTKKAYVRHVGFFLDAAAGPANGVNIFAGVGGRFWQLAKLQSIEAITVLVNTTFNPGNYRLVVSGRSSFLGPTNMYGYTPAESTDPFGEPGDFTWDNDYLYFKNYDGWKRIAWPPETW